MATTIDALFFAALSTAVAYHAWMGWGWAERRHPDLLTGSLTNGSEWWQFTGFLVTLAVLVTVAAWRLPAWIPVVVVTAVVLVVYSLNQSDEDALWAVGALFLTVYVLFGSAVLALGTFVVQRVRASRRGA